MTTFAGWASPLVTKDLGHRAEAVTLARTLDSTALARRTADDGWTVREELAHMASADADFIPRLAAMLDGEGVDMSVFAETDARNAQHLAERADQTAESIANELETNNRELETLYGRLTDEDAERQPPGLPFTLSALIAGYSQHGAYHVGQIQNALKE